MKKILILFISFLVFSMTSSFATTNWDSEASLNRVNKIGQKIMQANGLPTQITFKVSETEDINAYANIEKEVYIFKGLLQYVEKDDELAGVISHEISHILHSHIIKNAYKSMAMNAVLNKITDEKTLQTANVISQVSSLKMSRNDEYEADLTGVDLMVKAGYNPLGMISVLNKICEKNLDFFSSHPSGDKRVTTLYNYITYNYPQYYNTSYPTQSYADFRNYMAPIVQKRNSNEKKLAKFKKQQEKLKAKRLKDVQKLKNRTNPWETSFAILNAFASSSVEEE